MLTNDISIQNKKKFLINAAFFSLLALFLYVGFRLLPYGFPFILGFAAARAVIPASKLVSKRLNLPEKISRIICLTLFLTVILLTVAFISAFLAQGLGGLIKALPELLSSLPNAIVSFYEKMMSIAEGISPELALSLADTAATLTDAAGKLPEGLLLDGLKYLYGIVTGVPAALIFIGVSIVSSYLFVTDMPKISFFAKKFLPSFFTGRGGDALSETGKSVSRILIAYLKLMLLTFVELMIGFFILKIPYPFTLALLISFVDILPVLGVGTILVPWGIILLLLNKPASALGIFILYAIITTVRYIAEPKIVSDHIKLHPIITLFAVFLGLQLGGILGMFTLPIISVGIARYIYAGKNITAED